MVSCESKIIKILLGVFNLIWLILGGAVVYVGIQLVIWNKDFSAATDLAKINFKAASVVILIIGIVILLISFFGFFGACCENAVMLNIYAILMVFMIGAQIYAIVYSVQHKDEVKINIGDGVKQAITKITEAPETAKLLQELQKVGKCCGWDGPGDYAGIIPGKLPASCCDSDAFKQNATATCNLGDNKFTEGCKDKLKFDEITKYFQTSLGVGIAIVLFEFVLIFAACCLSKEVR